MRYMPGKIGSRGAGYVKVALVSLSRRRLSFGVASDDVAMPCAKRKITAALNEGLDLPHCVYLVQGDRRGRRSEAVRWRSFARLKRIRYPCQSRALRVPPGQAVTSPPAVTPGYLI